MRTGGRRAIGASIVVLALGLAGCGDQDSSKVAAESDVAAERVDSLNGSITASSKPDWYTDEDPELVIEYEGLPEQPTPTEPLPTEPPTYEPPELPDLDDTELQANLAALSPEDRALLDHYLEAPPGEGTYVVAAPMTVEEAKLRLLGPDPRPAKRRDFVTGESTAYAFLQVGDGVVAFEQWGFFPPPERVLAELSRDGATSAVVTDNVEAMIRFGYARDGEIVFDAFEYAFVDDLHEIPAEVRDLARLAWSDLEGPTVETADWVAVGLAMAEKVTGVRATDEAQSVTGKDGWYAVRWAAGE